MTEIQKTTLFPAGEKDPHDEPRDRRKSHSWTRNLYEIPGVEMVEVQMINAIVPTLLVSRLMPRVGRDGEGGEEGERPRFVINVSSPEGRFGVGKTGCHVHTNMAKSGLNMLTHTVAPQMAADGVFVNSVDTGWVSWMTAGGVYSFEIPTCWGECQKASASSACPCSTFPNNSYEHLPSKMAIHTLRLPLSRPPLSEEDGAARVLDPIFDGLEKVKQGKTPKFGCLFCHFESVSWENSSTREWRGREKERKNREKERGRARKRDKEEEEKRWKEEFG
eukprot:CAMPEP_0201517286 /NCGR_PEP_ID=MMETSP0161_2-20130828/8434_1 /ASSEMBLY_ACC=CAM_ASM_000251 /TAXON_ID=180227 /ORGANISM="Neoparamoeba aestuarina, Strain SoJaBio B1-5/56/2" /LENGTH=276 /DNA_ID=CAMNT_0047914733 /DNA_START=110 /DNA_END=936 /DNA_ORIENTATION=+